MKPKTIKILMWVLIALMTVQFMAAGLGKFTGAWTDKFLDWGYSISFMYLIGTVEILCVVGLYISTLMNVSVRKWAVGLLISIIIGAAVTHLMHAEYSRLIHNTIVIGMLCGVLYLNDRLAKVHP